VRVTTMTPSPEKNAGNPDKRLEVEDVFCYKTTMKILKALKKGERLDTSEITRLIRSNFADTASHLRSLEEQEILAHSNFGVRSHIYRFAETTRAKAVQKLLEAWEIETSNKIAEKL
jgi:predicted transcriptional regulator